MTDTPIVDATEADVRAAVRDARRVVVKIGSSSLASPQGGLNVAALDGLVDALAAQRLAGREVILVTSGAIAAGCEPLGMARRPGDLAQQQAAAAVGQGRLIARYIQAFEAHGITVAQVLLTVADISRRASFTNALRTFGALTRLGVTPIVNENDTVATREIRFGDNDRLAALVAEMVRARALVLLSDVDALYTAHPSEPDATRIPFVPRISQLVVDVSRPGEAGVGSGGMKSKVKAARMAAAAGIPTLVTSCGQVSAALSGGDVGTVFAPEPKRRPRRLLWLADASVAQGTLLVDAGAARALIAGSASLLAVGVRGVIGSFESGDPVDVVSPDGSVVARGFVAFGANELAGVIGQRFGHEVIHRDDMVVLKRASQ